MTSPSWQADARAAAETLRRHAAEVDRENRFPAESVAALREARLLGALVPADLGGAGLDLPAVAEICTTLGKACGSTAMIFAMHQIQIACLAAHGRDRAAVTAFLRDAAGRQLLVASGTSERAHGGDIRRSTAAVRADGDGFARLRKEVGTMSYGAHADALLVSARRSPEAAAGDQVLVLLPVSAGPPGAWADVRVTRPWDAVGLRGTQSIAATVEARFPAGHVLPVRFADILAGTMTPVSHVLWSAVWLGIAADALETAGRCLRGRLRDKQAPLPHTYAELVTRLYELHGFVREQARAVAGPPGEGGPEMRRAVELNSLKVRVSSAVVELVVGAMAAIGIESYLLDSDATLGRHLRDVTSAPLMIRNDRLVDTVTSNLTVLKTLL